MSAGPFSVIDKPELKFTSDPKDYVSGRLYWWEENGEYIRRDGLKNPETFGPLYDRQRLRHFTNASIILMLAYRETREGKFAQRAVDYIRVWFIDPKTAMNPNLNHAQIVPGHKVNGLGIIDTYDFYYLLDEIEYLYLESFITPGEMAIIKAWFRRFVKWLETNRSAGKERSRKNNHGTSYLVQLIRYQIFLGKKVKPFLLLLKARKNVLDKQVAEDGSQPHEQGRSKSLFYHCFNLCKLLHIAELGRRFNLDLFNYKDRLISATRYVLPHLEDDSHWPGEQIEKLPVEEYYEALFIAAEKYSLSEAGDLLNANQKLAELFALNSKLPPTLLEMFVTE